MDAPRFDALTKDWTRLPRRRVLGGLVAGALSPLLGYRVQEASATLLLCKRTRNCPTGKLCLHKVCVRKCTDPFTCSSGGGTGCTDPNCFCSKKPGGGSVCVRKSGQCDATLRACTSQRNCEFLEVCVASGCCGDFPKFACAVACDV
jgi:hypothetical protein